MKNSYLLFILLFLLLIFGKGYIQAQAESIFPIIVSEVVYDPDGGDTGHEMVKLTNVSEGDVDVSGWDLDADNLPYFTFPEGSIIPTSADLNVYLRADGASGSGSIFTGSDFGSSNMGNTSGFVALFHSTTHTEETIEAYYKYGDGVQTHEEKAIARGLLQEEAETGTGTTLDIGVQVHGSTTIQSSYSVEDPLDLRFETSSGASLYINGEEYITNAELLLEESGTYTYEYYAQLDTVQTEVYTLQLELEIIPPVVPQIILHEVAFHEEDDYVELFVMDDNNSGSGSVLQDYSVQVDSKVFTFGDQMVKTGDYIVLEMNDEIGYVYEEGSHWFRTDIFSGLVSTTEQVLLKQGGEIVDGVCWQKEDIPSSEIDDMEEIQTTVWFGDCILSEKVLKGDSINRDLNFYSPGATSSVDDWYILPVTTPGKENIFENDTPIADIYVQGSGLAKGLVPFQINLTGENSSDVEGISSYLWDYGDGTLVEGINPPSYTYTSSGNYEISLEVTDRFGLSGNTSLQVQVEQQEEEQNTGSSSSNTTVEDECEIHPNQKNIKISEIFPNPEGADTGKEWIEIYNPGEIKIEMCNIALDDAENGSRPYDLTGVSIQSKEYLVVSSDISKIVLNNSNESVRIINPETDEVLDVVEYETAEEGKSYSRFW